MTKRKKDLCNRGQQKVVDFLLVLLLIGLAVFQIFLANSLSSKGREISELDGKKQVLLREQSVLSSLLASLGSLDRIRADAVGAGMLEGVENFDYLIPPKVAYRP